MRVLGIGDEAGSLIDTQVEATRALGWKSIELRAVEVPGFAKANIHDIPDRAFDVVVEKLGDAGIEAYCFGSAIMNWGKKVGDPFEITLAEVARCIPRMHRLGTRFVRIMSYKPADSDDRIPPEVFTRVNEVVARFLDAGIQPLHENCMNYGGISPRHAAELLEKCPRLQWLFDPANPVFNPDRSKKSPWPRQDPWEFWTAVRDRTTHIHIKDARWNTQKKDADYLWPGEGDGAVRRILQDAKLRGYSGALSIEPHMVVVFHDANSKADESVSRDNFIEYGRRLEALVGSLS